MRLLFLPPVVVCMTTELCANVSEAGKPSRFCTTHPEAVLLTAAALAYTTVRPVE